MIISAASEEAFWRRQDPAARPHRGHEDQREALQGGRQKDFGVRSQAHQVQFFS